MTTFRFLAYHVLMFFLSILTSVMVMVILGCFLVFGDGWESFVFGVAICVLLEVIGTYWTHWLDGKPSKTEAEPVPPPSDDVLTLERMLAGNSPNSLDIPYPYQFVQNEEIQPLFSTALSDNHNVYPLAHSPVMPNTLTGTLYGEGHPPIVFVAFDSELHFQVYDGRNQFVRGPVNNSPHIVRGTIYNPSGEIVIEFTEPIPGSYIVVNYEYDYGEWESRQTRS